MTLSGFIAPHPWRGPLGVNLTENIRACFSSSGKSSGRLSLNIHENERAVRNVGFTHMGREFDRVESTASRVVQSGRSVKDRPALRMIEEGQRSEPHAG